jgi:4-carboxymuconolactone decarboxylase
MPVTTIDYAERRERGLRAYREIMGKQPPELSTPRAAALIDFVFAEVWTRGVLTRRERLLISLACSAGTGAARTLSDLAYGALLSEELTHDELGEFVLHFAVYCGWGAAENAEHLIDEQVTIACADAGREPPLRHDQPLTTVAGAQELRKQGGEQEFRDVNFAPAPPRGVPYYDDGILNFVFGDMWKRPGLSRRDRRWITLACVGLDDTVVPVRSHVYSAMKSGDIAFDEMREMVLQFAAYAGWPKASFMQQAVDEEHARVMRESEA